MIEIQQLLAAYLNYGAFGSTPSGLTLTQAGNDFCGTNAATILSDGNTLNNFNQGGDNLAFPAVYTNSSPYFINVSQPQLAKSIANYVFWNAW